MKKDRHKGTRIQIWLNDTDIAKLDTLATMSTYRTRASAIRMMLNGQPFVDQSAKDAVSLLGKIGGLMKRDRMITADQLKTILTQIAELRALIHGQTNSKA